MTEFRAIKSKKSVKQLACFPHLVESFRNPFCKQSFMWNPLYKSRVVAVEAKARAEVRLAQGSTGLFDHAEETRRSSRVSFLLVQAQSLVSWWGLRSRASTDVDILWACRGCLPCYVYLSQLELQPSVPDAAAKGRSAHP